MQEEVIETVAEFCPQDCIYRSYIEAGRTPICYYAALMGESRNCKISECNKYKGGKPIRAKMNLEYLLYWEYELYDEDADFVWRGHW